MAQQNENAKLIVCSDTTAKNECSVHCEGKMSKQLVANAVCHL